MDDIQVVKIIVAGDANTGKTSLLQRYCYNEFDPRQCPTIGCDFTSKVITKNGTQLKLQLWDVAGQDRYQNLSKMFIRQAKGCLIMCDITSKESLESALQWQSVVSDTADEVPIFLIQNKTDLIEGPPLTYQTEEFLNQFAQQHNFTQCYQISVKLNDKVDIVFFQLVEKMIEMNILKLEENIIKSSFHLKPEPHPKTSITKKGGCC